VLETGKQSLDLNQACVVEWAGIIWERKSKGKGRQSFFNRSGTRKQI
jgi:hypothetical protein